MDIKPISLRPSVILWMVAGPTKGQHIGWGKLHIGAYQHYKLESACKLKESSLAYICYMNMANQFSVPGLFDRLENLFLSTDF